VRNGRGPNPDHDQKSVDRTPAKVPYRRRKLKKEMQDRNIKQRLLEVKMSDCRFCIGPKCRGCWLLPEAFDNDKSRVGTAKLQSYCKECKDHWESTINGVHSRTMSWLEKYEPDSVPFWDRHPGGSMGALEEKWFQSSGRCFYCAGGLRKWQGRQSLTLDRQNNDERRHIPSNVVLCCWPCNHRKGSMDWREYKLMVDEIRTRAPHDTSEGVIWNLIDTKYKEKGWRATRHLVVSFQREFGF
jgi:5-methylcytosine-specific restriction endonuclease McrA